MPILTRARYARLAPAKDGVETGDLPTFAAQAAKDQRVAVYHDLENAAKKQITGRKRITTRELLDDIDLPNGDKKRAAIAKEKIVPLSKKRAAAKNTSTNIADQPKLKKGIKTRSRLEEIKQAAHSTSLFQRRKDKLDRSSYSEPSEPGLPVYSSTRNPPDVVKNVPSHKTKSRKSVKTLTLHRVKPGMMRILRPNPSFEIK